MRKLNFSILRIAFFNGQMKFQEKGMQKLSIDEKSELQIYLTNVLKKYLANKSSQPQTFTI